MHKRRTIRTLSYSFYDIKISHSIYSKIQRKNTKSTRGQIRTEKNIRIHNKMETLENTGIEHTRRLHTYGNHTNTERFRLLRHANNQR